MYVLHFQNQLDRENAIHDGPWAVHGALFCLNYWRPLIQVSHVTIWVQLHNLPMECLNSASGYALGKTLGEVIDVDAPEELPRNLRFLKFVYGLKFNNLCLVGSILEILMASRFGSNVVLKTFPSIVVAVDALVTLAINVQPCLRLQLEILIPSFTTLVNGWVLR